MVCTFTIPKPVRRRQALDAVCLSHVTKTFGSHTAVDDLSLQVPKGSIYGFIGPNGSGKTTTIRMILHILLADRGRIEVLGEEGTRAANDRVGYLPEERGLYKKMKTRALLVYYASLKGMGASEARRSADQWLERLGIPEWGGKKIEQLSKGMAQKVQFIATVLTQPELVILDEPFTGLDPVNLEALRSAILDLHRQGTTVIFSTHDMSMAEKMCDFVFMIYRGKKVLDGTLESILDSYGADTVRLRLADGSVALESIEGVERVLDMGRYLEVKYPGDPQRLLQQLAARAQVSLFEVSRPSLHDIFIRIASPSDEEAGDA